MAAGAPITADLNGDGHVGVIDLVILQSNFGRDDGVGTDDGDLSGDGVIGRADVTRLLDAFGNASQSAPTPDSLLLPIAPSTAPAAPSRRMAVDTVARLSIQTTAALRNTDDRAWPIWVARVRQSVTHAKSRQDEIANDRAIVEISRDGAGHIRLHACRRQLTVSRRIDERADVLSNVLAEIVDRHSHAGRKG